MFANKDKDIRRHALCVHFKLLCAYSFHPAQPLIIEHVIGMAMKHKLLSIYEKLDITNTVAVT
jgi:hypothetical protein